MEVEQHTQVPDGWEVVAHGAAPPAAVTPGSERTRPDTSIIGVDHEKLQQSIANWASTLSPKWQKPAAMLATFPADVLASLAEMFSAPESVAGAAAPKGVPALTAAGEQIGAARQAMAKPADLAIDALLKRTGLDPDAIDLATTRMRLQAARSQTRQARMTADLAEPQAAATPAQPSPVATSTAASAPGAPEGLAPAAPPAAPPPGPTVTPEAAVLKAQLKQQGLSDPEVEQVASWLQQGINPHVIWQRIHAARALQASGSFAKLPSTLDAQQAAQLMNAASKAQRAARAARRTAVERPPEE